MKRVVLGLTVLLGSALWLATPADAAGTQRCRDARGRFTHCQPGAAAAPTTATAAHPAAGALPAGVTRDRNGRCHAGNRFVACPH